MSYLDRLKAEIGRKAATEPTNKTNKTPESTPADGFVGFVGSSNEALRRAGDRECGLIWTAMRRAWARHGWAADSPEFGEAVEIALRDPEAAMDSLRADGLL
jgi:hypothetical protein